MSAGAEWGGIIDINDDDKVVVIKEVDKSNWYDGLGCAAVILAFFIGSALLALAQAWGRC